MLLNLIHIFNIQYKTTATLNFLYMVHSYRAHACVCVCVMSQELQCEVRCVTVEDE